jgi:septal ring factor EnvC (AmiA/AmiB activator)
MHVYLRQLRPRIAAAVTLTALAALTATTAFVLLAHPPAATGASLNQLNSELNANQARQSSLSSSIASLNGEIATLTGQIAGVEAREADVRATLQTDQAHLSAARIAVTKERALVALLKTRLAHARMILSRQLVSQYENARPDLMTVLLEAHGFNQLLDEINFLGRAESQQQQTITVTKTAKAQAQAAALRLVHLQAYDQKITNETAVEANALAGMNALLQSREAALGHARAAQQAALQAVQARGASLRAAIAHVQAEQAAAAAAAAALDASSFSGGPALGPSGGWSIPYAIVLCESGGQNLPPNSAGASGYYQIIPGTWRLFGGSGRAAYLAPKAEQDAVAARIWNNGAGWSNWVCAHLLGVH